MKRSAKSASCKRSKSVKSTPDAVRSETYVVLPEVVVHRHNCDRDRMVISQPQHNLLESGGVVAAEVLKEGCTHHTCEFTPVGPVTRPGRSLQRLFAPPQQRATIDPQCCSNDVYGVPLVW